MSTDSSSNNESWKLGILFGFCTSFVACLAKLAIRKSWMISDHNSWRSRSLRYAGLFGMSGLNPIFDVLAMKFASPSLLAPFSGLTLAWIIVLSSYLIGEQPQRAQIFAASLICVGEVFVMAFGDHSNGDHNIDAEVSLTYEAITLPYRTNVGLWVYFGCVAVWVLALFLCIQHGNPHQASTRFAWGMAGGSLTGVQCFLKDALTMLFLENGYQRFWTLPISAFILLALAIGCAVGGLLILSACMKRYDATFSNAMNAGAFVVSASIMAQVRYDTLGNLKNGLAQFCYVMGLVIILTGLFLLVRSTQLSEATDMDKDNQSDASTECDEDGEDQLSMIELATEQKTALLNSGKKLQKLRERSFSGDVNLRDRTFSGDVVLSSPRNSATFAGSPLSP